MKKRLIQLLSADKSMAEAANMAMYEFGLSRDKHYDVLVVAPGWKPDKIMPDYGVEIICTKVHSYLSGYEIKGDGFLIAWIQCSSGASSLIDELATCAYLNFDKLVFAGAVGSLVPEIGLGSLCTPEWSVSGNLANGYLLENIQDYVPFRKIYPNHPTFVDDVIECLSFQGIGLKKAPVFCTDSIFCEYSHLDFIKSFGVQLIEMETSSFYLMADLMEKPAIALLAVSDNSATGDPLLARTDEQKRLYNKTRKQVIPKIILDIAKMQIRTSSSGL